MRRATPLLLALATGTAAAVTPGFAATGASADSRHAKPLPHEVFAPYFETYGTSGGLAALSRQPGAKFRSLAFLETAQSGSCAAYWNGDTTEPIASSSFGSDISAIQASGGNVIPLFGGYTPPPPTPRSPIAAPTSRPSPRSTKA